MARQYTQEEAEFMYKALMAADAVIREGHFDLPQSPNQKRWLEVRRRVWSIGG